MPLRIGPFWTPMVGRVVYVIACRVAGVLPGPSIVVPVRSTEAGARRRSFGGFGVDPRAVSPGRGACRMSGGALEPIWGRYPIREQGRMEVGGAEPSSRGRQAGAVKPGPSSRGRQAGAVKPRGGLPDRHHVKNQSRAGGGAPSQGAEPRRRAKAPSQGAEPRRRAKAPSQGAEPRRRAKAPSQGAEPRRRAKAPSQGAEPRRRAKAPSQGAEPRRRAKAPSQGAEPRRRAKAPSQGAEPRRRAKAPSQGAEPRRRAKAPSQDAKPRRADQSPAGGRADRQGGAKVGLEGPPATDGCAGPRWGSAQGNVSRPGRVTAWEIQNTGRVLRWIGCPGR